MAKRSKGQESIESIVGNSRKHKIHALMAVGLSNEAVWSAMESETPSIITSDDPRRKGSDGKKFPPFDPKERERCGWAIRQVRNQIKDEMTANNDIVEITGGKGKLVRANEVEFSNIPRFSTGDTAIDYIYGETNFVFTKDDIEVQKGQKSEGEPTGERQVGLPEGWVSVWAGAPGVGKSRTAIHLARKVAARYPDREIMYLYGESELQQLRQWMGQDLPKNILLGDLKHTRDVLEAIYQHKPKIVIVDSLQMIVETRSGKGTRETLAALKGISSEEEAGRPHVVLISHLNKQGTLKGSNDIAYIVDTVAHLERTPKTKGGFMFEIPEKNRGGETPRGHMFRHTPFGIETVEAATKKSGKLVLNDHLPGSTGNPIIDSPLSPAPDPDKEKDAKDYENELDENEFNEDELTAEGPQVDTSPDGGHPDASPRRKESGHANFFNEMKGTNKSEDLPVISEDMRTLEVPNDIPKEYVDKVMGIARNNGVDAWDMGYQGRMHPGAIEDAAKHLIGSMGFSEAENFVSGLRKR